MFSLKSCKGYFRSVRNKKYFRRVGWVLSVRKYVYVGTSRNFENLPKNLSNTHVSLLTLTTEDASKVQINLCMQKRSFEFGFKHFLLIFINI